MIAGGPYCDTGRKSGIPSPVNTLEKVLSPSFSIREFVPGFLSGSQTMFTRVSWLHTRAEGGLPERGGRFLETLFRKLEPFGLLQLPAGGRMRETQPVFTVPKT
jgi:hypothetical protein